MLVSFWAVDILRYEVGWWEYSRSNEEAKGILYLQSHSRFARPSRLRGESLGNHVSEQSLLHFVERKSTAQAALESIPVPRTNFRRKIGGGAIGS